MICPSPTVRSLNYCLTTRTNRTSRVKRKMPVYGSYQFVYIGQPSKKLMYTSLLNENHLSKIPCKDYYSLFQSKWEADPTSVQSWSKHYPSFANKWNNLFKNISKKYIKIKWEIFFIVSVVCFVAVV